MRYYQRVLNTEGSVYSLWLFQLHSTVENTAFFPFSPWRDTRLRHFTGNPFGASRKKHQPFFRTQPYRITIFYDGAFRQFKKHIPVKDVRGGLALSQYAVILFYNILKMQTFSPVFPSMDSMLRSFYRSFLWNFKKALLQYVVVSSIQCSGKYSLFSRFPLGGIYG